MSKAIISDPTMTQKTLIFLALFGLISAESTYLTATLQPGTFQSFAIQEVHLYPGWSYPLKELTIQEMVPEVGSNFSRCHVRVIPGRMPVESDEDLHAHVYFPEAVESVTMYIQHSAPEVTDSPTGSPTQSPTHLPTSSPTTLNPNDHILVNLFASEWEHFQDQAEVALSPSWTSPLNHSIVRTMEPLLIPTVRKQQVTVVPGWVPIDVKNRGVHAIANMPRPNTKDLVDEVKITIFPMIHSGTTEVPPTDNPASYLEAVIFPLPWLAFKEDQHVRFSPGWDGHLLKSVYQNIVPEKDSQLVGQLVRVVPGYQTIQAGNYAAQARVSLRNPSSQMDPYDRVTVYFL